MLMDGNQWVARRLGVYINWGYGEAEGRPPVIFLSVANVNYVCVQSVRGTRPHLRLPPLCQTLMNAHSPIISHYYCCKHYKYYKFIELLTACQKSPTLCVAPAESAGEG